MSTIKETIDKLVQEQTELYQKLYRMDDFLQLSHNKDIISTEQDNLMWMQRNVMKSYIDILSLRIKELNDRLNK